MPRDWKILPKFSDKDTVIKRSNTEFCDRHKTNGQVEDFYQMAITYQLCYTWTRGHQRGQRVAPVSFPRSESVLKPSFCCCAHETSSRHCEQTIVLWLNLQSCKNIQLFLQSHLSHNLWHKMESKMSISPKRRGDDHGFSFIGSLLARAAWKPAHKC